jgi:hypothetical protein
LGLDYASLAEGDLQRRDAWLSAIGGLILLPLILIPADFYLCSPPLFTGLLMVLFLFGSPVVCAIAWLVTIFVARRATSSLQGAGGARTFTVFLSVVGLASSIATSMSLTALAVWFYHKLGWPK